MKDKWSISIASPPDRERLVAMIDYNQEQWAELNQEKGQFLLEIYPQKNSQPWVFGFDETLKMLIEAKRRLEEVKRDGTPSGCAGLE